MKDITRNIMDDISYKTNMIFCIVEVLRQIYNSLFFNSNTFFLQLKSKPINPKEIQHNLDNFINILFNRNLTGGNYKFNHSIPLLENKLLFSNKSRSLQFDKVTQQILDNSKYFDISSMSKFANVFLLFKYYRLNFEDIEKKFNQKILSDTLLFYIDLFLLLDFQTAKSSSYLIFNKSESYILREIIDIDDRMHFHTLYRTKLNELDSLQKTIFSPSDIISNYDKNFNDFVDSLNVNSDLENFNIIKNYLIKEQNKDFTIYSVNDKIIRSCLELDKSSFDFFNFIVQKTSNDQTNILNIIIFFLENTFYNEIYPIDKSDKSESEDSKIFLDILIGIML